MDGANIPDEGSETPREAGGEEHPENDDRGDKDDLYHESDEDAPAGATKTKKAVAYEMREELINVAWAKVIGSSDAATQIVHGCSIRRWLGIFLDRALRLAHRRGSGKMNFLIKSKKRMIVYVSYQHFLSCRRK